MKLPRRTKYGSRKTTVDGILFDSAREARAWQKLRLMESCGEIEGLQRQVPFVLTVNGVKVCKYIADFVYTENGMKVVTDAKGVRTREYLLKKKLMKALYGIEITEL